MSKVEKVNPESHSLFSGVAKLIQSAEQKAAVYLNTSANDLYWSIGHYVITELNHEVYSGYGKQILATLSQQLSEAFGKGYSYSALTRMIKVADAYDKQMFATLSQTLSWSHFIELAAIEDDTQRLFYQKMPIGLLLCSEGNTEHIELLLLGEENIKGAQYLTVLPNKQWFIEKLHKAIAIAQEQGLKEKGGSDE